MNRLFGTFFFLLLLLPATVFSQEVTKITLVSASDWKYNSDILKDVQRIIGNVILNHDSAFLYCDSAYLFEKDNNVIAYGNVRVKLSDTLNLYSDSLKYDGNTKVARANSNVRLIDNQTILSTDTMVYDRKTQIAQYDYWAKIVNDKNVLVSRHGYYYTDKKEFFFKTRVLLLNPDYEMRSDTLMYNTLTETSYFYGPTQIVSKDKQDSIYCENGWYDTRFDRARFRKKAKIYHDVQFLTGDSLYYERKNGYGQVFRHAILKDTVQNVLLTGNYGELQRKNGFAFMIDRAVAVFVDKKDSLFMHADTIRASFDTAKTIKKVYCYYKVKFFRTDLQGMSDSLVYSGRDSVMTMYKEPVLWSGPNQLTADSVKMTMRNGQADSLFMYNSTFIISKDDTARFNQIKGRDLLAKFRDNELYKIRILGNAETIYYAREEDRSLIGINKAISSDMLIFLEKNQLQSITYIDKPEAKLVPENDFPIQEIKLKGFKWLEERRPRTKWEIFTW
jgi:lipopolysaccharide export system protein LptA